MIIFSLKRGPGGTPPARIPMSITRDYMYFRANVDHHLKVSIHSMRIY